MSALWEDDRSSDDIARRQRWELRVCLCGHDFADHSYLSTCMVVLPEVTSGFERSPERYCACLDFQEER